MPIKREDTIEMSLSDWGKIIELTTDVKYIRMNVEQLTKTIEGNGKPGLKQDVHDLMEWKSEKCEDLDTLIMRNSNSSYFKRGLWEAIRWIGSGTLIALYFHFFKD